MRYFAELLGSMRYQLVASPDFQQRWFAKGLNRSAARKAPVFAYSRKDTLHSDFMQSRFGLHADTYPTHYLSLPEARLKAIRRGLGYGMVPYMQVSDSLKSRDLVDVARGISPISSFIGMPGNCNRHAWKHFPSVRSMPRGVP